MGEKIQFFFNIFSSLKSINFNLRILKKKNYAYHLAYKVDNLEKTIFKLKKKFKLIINPTPAKAFNNKKVAFFTISDGFVIELIQS